MGRTAANEPADLFRNSLDTARHAYLLLGSVAASFVTVIARVLCHVITKKGDLAKWQNLPAD
jgi:hypothetical protein